MRNLVIAFLFFNLALVPARAQETAPAPPPQTPAPAEVPLDKPNLEIVQLLLWVMKAVPDVMTFGYEDYDQRMTQSSKYFTRAGWDAFSAAMKRARIAESVSATQETLTAKAHAAPVMTQAGSVDGTWRWIVTIPVDITHKTVDQEQMEVVDVIVMVGRVPASESPDGVGIMQWTSTPAQKK